MERKFHPLDSFAAKGSDGASYKVIAYEHMRRDDTVQDGQEHWAPTGTIEYRLESGELIDMHGNGRMQVAATGLELERA